MHLTPASVQELEVSDIVSVGFEAPLESRCDCEL